MRPALTVSTSTSYEGVLQQLVDDKVASRVAAQDPTVWGPDAESDASIRLSWVRLPVSSRPLLAEIEALRAELWAEGIDQVVLCGMGGSSLAPEVISRTYDVPLTIVDSTNPSVVGRAVRGDLSRTAVVVSSKSGGTLETDSQRRAFAAAFERAGIDASSRLVAVTDPGSALETLAKEQGYRKVFLADPNVGGRYSALTAFGLVPTGLAGVDVADLLDEAEEVMTALSADSKDNPALMLASALVGGAGCDKAAIADFESRISGFADWAEQLIAESTGKEGTGLLPVAVEGPSSPEVRWPAHDVVVAGLTAPETSAPEGVGEPWVTVSGTLGAQFLTWETATAVIGRLLGINPFDQPDVESAKTAARGLLDEQPAEEPAEIAEDSIEARASGDLLSGVDSVAGAIEALLSQLGDDSYLAVMAYLDSERDASLRAVRPDLARRTERPTTFGWGPRFLHSTGQYHKGGRPHGVFLQITSHEPEDLEIPDRPFTFQTLISAQAAGDARVLAEHGRPVLRLHLLDPAAGVPVLERLLR